MMSKLIKTDNNYKAWLTELKQRIRQSQKKAAVKVNVEMLHLYWSVGEDIVKRNAEALWGKSVINQVSQDLGKEFPDMKGFSPRNHAYMKQFYLFYSGGKSLQQVVAKIDNKITIEILYTYNFLKVKNHFHKSKVLLYYFCIFKQIVLCKYSYP